MKNFILIFLMLNIISCSYVSCEKQPIEEGICTYVSVDANVCNAVYFSDWTFEKKRDTKVPCEECDFLLDFKLEWWLSLNKYTENKGFTEENFHDYFKCE